MVIFFVGFVILDLGFVYFSFVVFYEKMSLIWKDICVDLEGSCSILGFEGIILGRCYWEVAVRSGDRSEWVLGVCSKDVKRKGWYRECLEKGFWIVGYYEKNYCVCIIF